MSCHPYHLPRSALNAHSKLLFNRSTSVLKYITSTKLLKKKKQQQQQQKTTTTKKNNNNKKQQKNKKAKKTSTFKNKIIRKEMTDSAKTGVKLLHNFQFICVRLFKMRNNYSS